jgi:hypothetical protein
MGDKTRYYGLVWSGLSSSCFSLVSVRKVKSRQHVSESNPVARAALRMGLPDCGEIEKKKRVEFSTCALKDGHGFLITWDVNSLW